MKRRVAFLASGGGSNVEVLLKAMQAPDFPAQPVLIFSNNPDAAVLAKAAAYGVPSAVLDHRLFKDRAAFDAEVLSLLKAAAPDYLCLAGYMRIVTPAFVDAFPGRILNIHPSLLPKFGGKGMYGHHVHEAVLKAGEAESGATVHLVDHLVDHGRILLQKKVPVLPSDTPESLAARVLQAEHQAYPEALRQLCLASNI